MITTVMLTAKEFSQLHNAMCDLRSVQEDLEEVIHPRLYSKVVKSLAEITKALTSAYQQEDQVFAQRSAHYSDMSEKFGERLGNSIWSMYEVDCMMDPHPWKDANCMLYDAAPPVPINGPLWIDLWLAANEAIKQSKDEHHVFIEAFTPSQIDPKMLNLSTGS